VPVPGDLDFSVAEIVFCDDVVVVVVDLVGIDGFETDDSSVPGGRKKRTVMITFNLENERSVVESRTHQQPDIGPELGKSAACWSERSTAMNSPICEEKGKSSRGQRRTISAR